VNWSEELIESLTGTPPNTFWTRVFMGVIVPFLVGLLGISLLVVQRLAVYAKGDPISPAILLHGHGAIVCGLMLISIGLGVHFHYFWTYRKPVLAALGKPVTGVAGVILFCLHILALVSG
jgi:hypothetical protein